MTLSPEWFGSVGWVSSLKAKDFWFDSQSGYMPGLQVWSLVKFPIKAHVWDVGLVPSQGTYERQPIDVSLPLFLPPFSSL